MGEGVLRFHGLDEVSAAGVDDLCFGGRHCGMNWLCVDVGVVDCVCEDVFDS